jgi:hypothetical protein
MDAIQIVVHVIRTRRVKQSIRVRRHCFTLRDNGGRQAASIVIFLFHATEMQHIFPHDDT